MKSVLVTDLGGTKSRVARMDERLRVVAEREWATEGDAEHYFGALLDALRTVRGEGPRELDAPAAIGVGFAGVVHADGQTIDNSSNLPFEPGFRMGQELEREFGLPARVINDGRASAVGEFHFGNARGRDPLLALFFGTGIGIGLVSNGEPYGGIANAAGEVGHTLFVPDGLPCPCGRHGCFEAYCGGGPMTSRAAVEIGDPPNSGRWTVSAIVERAAAGDAVAESILRDAEQAASTVVANLCTVLNPAAVVLGGGVLKGWPALSTSIERFVRDWCAPIIGRDLEFVPSRGGSDAILWGAAAATGVF